jgi:hypothetical protein
MSVLQALVLAVAFLKVSSALRLLPLSLSQGTSPVNGDPCAGFDCPDFVLKASRDGYVVRSYSEGEPGLRLA